MFYRIIIKLFIVITMSTSFSKGLLNPTLSVNKPMSCEEFGATGRFNPYSILENTWMVFFYWAPAMKKTHYRFLYPTGKERSYIKEKLEGRVSIPVNWTAKHVLMFDLMSKTNHLLVEKGDRGQFWLYTLHIPRHHMMLGKKVDPVDVLLKQTPDNKYIALMYCKEYRVLIMCRLTQIPRKKFIPDAVAEFGYRGRQGKSYLYQGHHWMPIPEADEEDYWQHPHAVTKANENIEKEAWKVGHTDREEQKILEQKRKEKKIHTSIFS